MFYCRYKWYRTCDSAMYGQQLDISKVFCCQQIRQMENELSEIGTLKYESDRAENIVNRVCWKEVRLYEILYVWGHPETPLRQAIAYVYRMLSSAWRTHNRCKPNQLDFCFFIVTGGSEFYHLWLRAKKKKKKCSYVWITLCGTLVSVEQVCPVCPSPLMTAFHWRHTC